MIIIQGDGVVLRFKRFLVEGRWILKKTRLSVLEDEKSLIDSLLTSTIPMIHHPKR